MARIARVVVPGIPHHISQRGNRRMDTFFSEADYREYLSLMAEWCNRCKVQVWAYCLMTNHVHLIVVPESTDGLRRAIGEAHRRYSRYINFQKGWTGIVKKPENYKWSSAKAHLQGENDILVEVEPLLSIIPDWQELLSGDLSVEEYEILRRHERSGRPLGSDSFMVRLEK